MKLVYMRVGFSKEVELYAYEDYLEIKPNLLYIIDTRHGKDMGFMEHAPISFTLYEQYQKEPDKYFKILKPASKDDIKRRWDMKQKSKEYFDVTQKKISEHQLPIKLINTYAFFEGNKILFNFYSETRVDFRNLVKELASLFKSRIELHQVGIRDFSQFFNQIGICGRPFCCSTIKTHKNSISLKMAKEQNLHINASKLSGVCGRLMCCLNYEYDNYKIDANGYPVIGDDVYYKNTQYFVKEFDQQKNLVHIFNDKLDIYEEISLDQYLEIKKR
jgi:cell fate regulator YaaT (PSP1 superfamily)